MGKQRFAFAIAVNIFSIVWNAISSQILLTPETILVDENSTLTLTCTFTASGNSLLIRWVEVIGDVGGSDDISKGNVILPSCQPFSETPDSTKYSYNCIGTTQMTWTILNVNKDNEGDVWACSKTDEVGRSEYSNGARIKIKVAIISVVMTYPILDDVLQVVEYSKQMFTCTTSIGVPAANIYWYTDAGTADDLNDDVEIINDIIISESIKQGQIQVRSELTLNTSRHYDNKRIYCTAVNIEGQTPLISNRKLLLKVFYAPDSPPVILGYSNGEVHVVAENTTGRLTCSSSGGNPLPSLAWLCYNIGTSINTETTVTRTVTWTVEKETERRCSCKSTQEVAGIQTAYVDIQILYKASITKFVILGNEEQTQVSVMEHSNVTFVCDVDSNPASNLKVMFKNSLITEQISSQTLTRSINDVKCSDNGTYSCTGTNAYNYGVVSRQDVDLLVKCPPSLLGTLTTDILAGPYASVVITVPVVTYPELTAPDILWQKWENGTWTPVEYSHTSVLSSLSKASRNGSTVTYVSLMIIALTPELSGKYMMTVNNGIGSLNAVLNVGIQKESGRNNVEQDIDIGSIVGAAIGGVAVGVIITVVAISVWKCRRKDDINNIRTFTPIFTNLFRNVCAPGKHKEEIELNTRNESTYETVDQEARTRIEHAYSSTEPRPVESSDQVQSEVQYTNLEIK